MKDEVTRAFLVVFGLTAVAMGVLAIWLIGSEMLATLALVFVSGLTLALIIVASAFPIRAWRKNDSPPVIERRIHDGTRTIVRETKMIDGRQALPPEVKLLQLPAGNQAGAFPELLRASYRAGIRVAQSPEPPVEAEVQELDPGEPAGWDGPIVR